MTIQTDLKAICQAEQEFKKRKTISHDELKKRLKID